MIGQFDRAATTLRVQIILSLDFSPPDPSMKVAQRGSHKIKGNAWQPSWPLGQRDDCKCTTASISAVCGNMSSGVTDSIANFSCSSLKSRANVGGLHET